LAVKIEQPAITEPWDELPPTDFIANAVHPMYDNVNQTVVDRFNSIAHQAYSLEDFEFLFDSTANLEALDNSADLHSLSSSLSYAKPDD
jgi:hypothetical protein